MSSVSRSRHGGEIGADPWGFAYACAVFLGGEFYAGLVAILGLATHARVSHSK